MMLGTFDHAFIQLNVSVTPLHYSYVNYKIMANVIVIVLCEIFYVCVSVVGLLLN